MNHNRKNIKTVLQPIAKEMLVLHINKKKSVELNPLAVFIRYPRVEIMCRVYVHIRKIQP